MPRRRESSVMSPLALGLFAWEAGVVFTMRSLELWAEPAEAQARLAEYAMEKQQAFATAALKAGEAAMIGAAPAAVLSAAVAPVRRRVRANARALRRR
ncbi:MAG TPA: hypothetical protein VE684_17680 [Crenalkalicoccus sp.]|nr:hypothetical protein [Crenalkalicoccus sp.]